MLLLGEEIQTGNYLYVLDIVLDVTVELSRGDFFLKKTEVFDNGRRKTGRDEAVVCLRA